MRQFCGESNQVVKITFSAPPGILVGHFTQLVWAQAWKIGCGRIVYKPEGKKRFENNIICGCYLRIYGRLVYKGKNRCQMSKGLKC